jgi:hypothetical protein
MTIYFRAVLYLIGPWLILLAIGLLTGCATQFENRVLCSPDLQDAAFVSWYEGIGVGASIVKRDANIICARSISTPAAAASAPAKGSP